MVLVVWLVQLWRTCLKGPGSSKSVHLLRETGLSKSVHSFEEHEFVQVAHWLAEEYIGSVHARRVWRLGVRFI